MSLYISGIPPEADLNLLTAAFAPFGDIKNIEMPLNYENIDREVKKSTGSSNEISALHAVTGHRGYAFIDYIEEEDARHAQFNLNGSELCGRSIYVRFKGAAEGDILLKGKKLIPAKLVEKLNAYDFRGVRSAVWERDDFDEFKL